MKRREAIGAAGGSQPLRDAVVVLLALLVLGSVQVERRSGAVMPLGLSAAEPMVLASSAVDARRVDALTEPVEHRDCGPGASESSEGDQKDRVAPRPERELAKLVWLGVLRDPGEKTRGVRGGDHECRGSEMET